MKVKRRCKFVPVHATRCFTGLCVSNKRSTAEPQQCPQLKRRVLAPDCGRLCVASRAHHTRCAPSATAAAAQPAPGAAGRCLRLGVSARRGARGRRALVAGAVRAGAGNRACAQSAFGACRCLRFVLAARWWPLRCVLLRAEHLTFERKLFTDSDVFRAYALLSWCSLMHVSSATCRNRSPTSCRGSALRYSRRGRFPSALCESSLFKARSFSNTRLPGLSSYNLWQL